jgi:type I restriction enzyme R subunit
MRADFLEDAIQDYNDLFGTSFDTSADKFQNYYKDLSQRLKNRELDLVIVVNMFLTGFDATTLNTLWVDKNLRGARPDPGVLAHQPDPELGQDLRQHRLLPRPRGATNDAIALFGNKDAGHRAAQALRRVLREYAEKVASCWRVPRSGADHRRGGAEGVHRVCSGRSCGCEHPHVLRRLRRQRDPHRPAEVQDYRSVYLDLYAEFRKDARRRQGGRSTTTSSSRSSSSSRSRSTSTTSSCSSRSTATSGRRRRQGDPRRDHRAVDPARPCATRRTSSRTSSTGRHPRRPA